MTLKKSRLSMILLIVAVSITVLVVTIRERTSHADATTAIDVPPFVLQLADQQIDSDSLQGTAVYLDFWASWCVPCRDSFPWMNQMQAQYAEHGLRIIAVNVDGDRSLAERFLHEHPADFEIAYDPDGDLANQFHVIGMPMAFLIDRQGQLVDKHIGFNTVKEYDYEQSIRKLLGL